MVSPVAREDTGAGVGPFLKPSGFLPDQSVFFPDSPTKNPSVKQRRVKDRHQSLNEKKRGELSTPQKVVNFIQTHKELLAPIIILTSIAIASIALCSLGLLPLGAAIAVTALAIIVNIGGVMKIKNNIRAKELYRQIQYN